MSLGVASHRLEVVRWAKTLFDSPEFAVLDTETTGMGADDELVSIGVIDGQGNVLLDSLIKPSKSIPSQVTRIHGISNRHVANAPSFPEVYPEIARIVRERVVVVYNLSFDRRMLAQCQSRYRLPPFRYRETHCAMLKYAQFYGQQHHYRRSFRWHSLTNACSHLGIEVFNAHNAIGDCRLTLELLRHMAGIAC